MSTTREEFLSISARQNNSQNIPSGQAVLHKAENELLSVDDPQKFRVELGQGVEADIDNQQVLVGNRKLMDNNLVLITPEMIDIMKFQENRGKTVLLVAIEQSIIGIITVADRIKGESREIVEELKE